MFKKGIHKGLCVVLNLLGGLVLLTVGCAPRAEPTPAPVAEVKAKYGGVMRFHRTEQDPTHDLQIETGREVSMIWSLVSHRLLTYKILKVPEPKPGEFIAFIPDALDVTPYPDLAERWDISPDGKTFTFYLRQGVKWQNVPPLNGREFTSEDVKFTWERIMDTKTKSKQVRLTENISRIETPDKYTVRFVTKEDYAPMLYYFTDPFSAVVPKEVFEQGKPKTDLPVGMGAFIMTNYEPDVRTVFKKNPDFWNKSYPYLDGVEMVFIKDLAAALAAFRAKQVDTMDEILLGYPIEYLQKAVPDARFYTYLSSGILSLHVGQTTIPPLKDYRVRKALSLALDRKEIIDKVYLGQAIVSGIPGPSFAPFARPQEETEKMYGKRDLAQAKMLLAEAGYPNGFKVEMRTAPFGEKHINMGQLFVSQLGELGLDIEFKPIPERAAYNSYREGHLIQLSTGTTKSAFDVDDVLSKEFDPKSPENYLGVNDPKLTELIYKQRMELDLEKRKRIVREIDDYLYEHGLYIIPILQEYGPEANQGYVRSYVRQRANGQGYSAYQIWLDK